MKAYEVTIEGWENLRIIVSAPSRGKAKSLQCLALYEAGFETEYLRFRAIRAPAYDPLCFDYEVIGLKDKYRSWGVLSR